MNRWIVAFLVALVLCFAARADTGVVHGVWFTRENVVTGPGGTTATVRVIFPAGFGVSKARTSRRLLGDFPLGTIPLDENLNPTGTHAMVPSAVSATALFAVHEQLPVAFETTQIVWDVAAGTFEVRRDDTHYVRKDELANLAAWQASLVDSSAAARPSNEAVFAQPAASTALNVLVGVDANGCAVLADARVDLPASSYTAHFPADVNVAWSQTGAVVMTAGAVDAAASGLPGAQSSVFTHHTHCPAKPAAPAGEFTFTLTGNAWKFTSDGGLRAEGGVVAAPLKWGARSGGAGATFVHETGAFTAAGALFAGHVLRGAAVTVSDDNRAGALLLSGHGMPGDAAYAERPGTAGYADGLADYAGLNFRVATDGAQTAVSRLGSLSGGAPGEAVVGPYDLKSRSKYYVRPGGVSGIHEAVTASFTALTGGLSLHGFPMTLTGMQVSYLDNHNHDSLIGGTISVPGVRGNPGFTQPFDNVMLLCDGQLGELTLPGGGPEQTLHYWRAKFTALTGEFLHQPAAAPVTHALVLGAEVSLPGVVKEPLTGGLGFFPNGNLVSAADGFTGVNSRLRRPARINLHGTRSALDASKPGFTVQPVCDLYFNHPDAASAPNPGFVAFAGKVDVPFFENIPVHVLARATSGDSIVRGGWSDAGRTFFNDAKFDASNQGFPSLFGDAFALYAGGAGYHPRARQKWLGFVNFDMPVLWDAVRRQFVSAAPTEENFLVVSTQRVIQRLTPSGADLRFGAQFEGLPRVNLAALVIDEDEAVNEIIQHLPNGPQLAAAAKTLGSLIDGRGDALIDSAVDAAVDAYLDTLFAPGGPLNGIESATLADAALAGTETGLRGQLDGIVGTVNDSAKVLGEIKEALDKLDLGLNAADALLAKDGQGKRGTFVTSTIAIGGDDAEEASASIDTLINVDLRETLDEIQSAVTGLHDAVAQARPYLNAAGGIADLLGQSLSVVNGGGLDLSAQAVAAMRQHFASAHDPTGLYLTELGQTQVRAALKQIVRDQIHATGFVADLQGALRDLLEPLRDDYQLAFERIHGVLNDVLRTAFSELGNTLALQLGDAANIANKASGVFRDTLELAKVEGTARIEGDTLVNAHLNAAIGLRVPDKVGLSGWLDYRSSKSAQPVPGCAAGVPDGRVEIGIGAAGQAGIQGNPPVLAKLEGRYAMKSDGTPLAVTGSLEFDTELKFDYLSLRKARFEFGVGERDNYLFAQGAGTVLFIDANVRAFMGRTCDRALLERVDADLQPVLNKVQFPVIDAAHPISGIYWNGDGDCSLNRFFGLPDKPVSIKGRGGQGGFWFCNDAILDWQNPGAAKLINGMRIRRGLEVSIGPASATAELVVLGAVDQLQLLKAADDFPEFRKTVIDQVGLVSGGVAGRFTPVFQIGPVKFSKDFRFSSRVSYTPVPPPGFFWANKLEFD